MIVSAGFVDDVGRVETAAEPDFEQQEIRRRLGEREKRRRGGDLEEGDGVPGVDVGDPLQQRRKRILVDRLRAIGVRPARCAR